jgi:hypothetical protein
MNTYYIVQTFMLGVGTYLALSDQAKNFSTPQIVGMILMFLAGFSIVLEFLNRF